MKTTPHQKKGSLTASLSFSSKALKILLASSYLGLSACASIVSKSHYPVTITSNPPGAQFKIRKSSGEYISSGTTPTTLDLPSSFGYFQPAKYNVKTSA
jgi:hypothetical protein